MLHVWGKGEVQRGFWWGNLKERYRHRLADNIKMDLGEVGCGGGGGTRTGSIWLRTGTVGRPL
jgi:hypothetical protein